MKQIFVEPKEAAPDHGDDALDGASDSRDPLRDAHKNPQAGDGEEFIIDARTAPSTNTEPKPPAFPVKVCCFWHRTFYFVYISEHG